MPQPPPAGRPNGALAVDGQTIQSLIIGGQSKPLLPVGQAASLSLVTKPKNFPSGRARPVKLAAIRGKTHPVGTTSALKQALPSAIRIKAIETPASASRIYFVYLYPKNEEVDLSAEQKRELKQIAHAIHEEVKKDPSID